VFFLGAGNFVTRNDSVVSGQALNIYRRLAVMDISRKLGILVFFGVPAIVGGGIIFAIFGSYTPMFIYEALLILLAGGFISN
jgi:hypothetical protein